MRRAARTDDNHVDVRDAFRDLGIKVRDMAGVGKGFPDLLLAFGGAMALVEVKDGKKPPSKRKRSDGQLDFAENWPGRVELCESLDDVPGIVARLRQDAEWLSEGRMKEGRP